MTRLCASPETLARRRAEAGVPLALVEENAELRAEVAALKRSLRERDDERERLRALVAADRGQGGALSDALAMGLTVTEARVYAALRASSDFLGSARLAQAASGPGHRVSPNSVRSFVVSMRRKFAAARHPLTIESRRGGTIRGYRLVAVPP